MIRVKDSLWKGHDLGMGLGSLRLCFPTKTSPPSVLMAGSKGPTTDAMLVFISGRFFPETWGMCFLWIWLALACHYTLDELQMEISRWNAPTGEACSGGLTWLAQNKTVPEYVESNKSSPELKCLRRHYRRCKQINRHNQPDHQLV